MIKTLAKLLIPQKAWKGLQLIKRKLESLVYQMNILRYPSRFVHHTYSGVPLSVLISDPQAEAWYDKDWKSLPELATLKKGKLRPLFFQSFLE